MSQIDRTDGLVGNAAIKYPCRMASTANLVLSGLQTIDGIVGAQDDRVLVKNQTTGTQNGIYVMDSGDWERAQDADNDGAFTEGSLVKVNNGTVGSGFWYVTNTGTITIDSTSITFAKASTVLATVSVAWQAVIAAATLALGMTAMGFSAFFQTLIGAASASAFRALITLGTGDSPTFTAVTTTGGATVGTLLDLSAAGAGQVKFPATQNASANANTLDDYVEGSFTATLTGCTTAPTYTINYVKVGNIVTLSLSGGTWNGTSNATTKTLTGMPAAIRPSATRYGTGMHSDNSGAYACGNVSLSTGGVLAMAVLDSAAGWTGSGAAVGYFHNFTYQV